MPSTEIVLPSQDIPKEIRAYGQELSGFAYHTRFPEDLLYYPDYVMFKAPNADGFKERVDGIKTWAAEQPIFTEVDWRFVVMAHLAVPVELIDRRPVENVEVMEAKSREGTVDYLGVEYASFFVEDFGEATSRLGKRHIHYELMADGYSRWLNICINGLGQEVRLSDHVLAEALEKRLEDGTAHYI